MTTARGSTTPQAAGTLTVLADIVVNTPEGNIAATNVQDAINELDTEKVAKAGDTMTGDLTVPNLITSGNVDGRDVSVDGTKLDTIESGATADQTAAEIKTAYESNADTNAYTDAAQTKLAGIETGATADQSAAEIKTAYESNANTNAFTDAEKTNLANQSGTNTGDEPAASLTVSGIVELATQAEVDTGTDALRAITPSTLAGSALQTKVNGIEAGATADQTAGEIEAIVNHDNLIGFVANEHIDHSAVSISAGTGLTGGGTLAANRTLSLNVNGLTVDASPDTAADYLVTYDASAGTHKKVLVSSVSGAGPFSDSFTSSEQAITSAGSLTLPHGLSSAPSLVQCRLICKTAEQNYSIGDEVIVAMGGDSSATNNNYGIVIIPDSTNLNIRYGSDTYVFRILNKTTGAGTIITNANWKLIVKAWV